MENLDLVVIKCVDFCGLQIVELSKGTIRKDREDVKIKREREREMIAGRE